MKHSQFTFPAGAAGDAERRDLEAFLMCFPTDTHPAVGTQLTVDGANKNTAGVTTLLASMTALADTGDVGLVAKGRVGGIARGYVYAGSGNFQSDRASERRLCRACRVVELTATAVDQPHERGSLQPLCIRREHP